MKIYKHNLKFHKRAGFSIAEVMIAMFILLVGILSVVRVTGQTIKLTAESRNIVIASELAQEGIELVRNIRDNNAAQDNRSIFEGFGGNGSACTIDYAHTQNVNCGGNPTLYRTGSGFYVHNGSENTGFKRHIVFTGVGANQVTVTSYVSWGGASLPTSTSACTTKNLCTFTQIALTAWISPTGS